MLALFFTIYQKKIKNIMRNSIIILLGLIPTLVLGQFDRSVRPKAGPAPTINIKNSEVFQTKNGITVILSENHAIPKVSFDLVMGSDPILEKEKAGLSNIAGEMIMSGTSKRDKDKLDNEVDYIGASLYADQNSIFLSCLTKYKEKGLELMNDVLINASFPESEFDRIVKQYESSLKSQKSNPSAMASSAKAKANFNNTHPYSEIMTDESLANIKLEDIKNYYKTVFTPQGSYLVVVGDINLEQTKSLVEKYFSSWTGSAAYKNDNLTPKPANGSQVYFVNKTGSVQSVINVTYPMNVKPGSDDEIGLSVLNNLLGGSGFSSRLMQNLREDKAYTYGCYSSFNIDDYGSVFTAGGNFRNEVTDSAITQILYEIARITEEYATDEELNLIKSSMAGSFARSLERPQTIARFALRVTKYNLDKDYYTNYLKKLAAVNKDDILLLAQKYLSSKNVNIVVVGNESILENLKQFDKDGKIDLLDAFGNKVVENKPADISADKLIENYILAVTKSTSIKSASKKLKKIKTYTRITDLSSPQIPIPIKLTEVWLTPNLEGNKMEGQGMVFQKTYFDGKAGGTSAMQGGKVELTADEIAAKSKSVGLFPEMNFNKSGMKYEITGIEVVDGKEMYKLAYDDGASSHVDFYDKETFMKMKSVSTSVEGEETQTTEISYSDYREVNGVMMPYGMTLTAGPMAFEGKVSSFTVNEKVDLNNYK
jgi:predicted Zn-dependent peptidase